MNKRLLCLVLSLLLLSAFACTPKANPVIAETPSETPSLAPTDAPTEAPTPEPTPEPITKITDDWYKERCEQLKKYVKLYGSCANDNEVNSLVYSMAIDPDLKMVAFTFDDGPKDGITDAILDILQQYNARATFFIKGEAIEGHEAQLKRILALGCEIGNHTWSHSNIEELTADEMRTAIVSVNDRIEELFGYRIRLFRPPYIAYGDKGSAVREALVSLMRELDMAVVNHTRSVHDTYDEYTADMIYERGVLAVDELGFGLDGSIILCHDKSEKMVEAFGRIVPELIAQGYQFVTVSELLQCSSEGLNSGWIYRKAD